MTTQQSIIDRINAARERTLIELAAEIEADEQVRAFWSDANWDATNATLIADVNGRKFDR